MERPKLDSVPGLKWRRKSKTWVAIWIARDDIAKRGYRPTTQRLWEGTAEQLTSTVALMLQAETDRLQTAMLSWANGKNSPAEAPSYNGTLASLIQQYLTDEVSPFHLIREGTQKTYRSLLGQISKDRGRELVADLKGENFIRWYWTWRQPKKEGGKERISGAHGLITMAKIVVLQYGAGVKAIEECLRLKLQLTGDGCPQFPNGRRRRQFMTADQAVALRAKANELGKPSIALAQAFMFDVLGLRQKDVIGEWVTEAAKVDSSIVVKKKKWIIGLDWQNITEDLILTHRVSKTLDGHHSLSNPDMGELIVRDLKRCPMVMAELANVPEFERRGPVIRNERTQLPWHGSAFTDAWRVIANHAGLPSTVQNRDSRSGAVTESTESTNDFVLISQEAVHTDPQMTMRYNKATLAKSNRLQDARTALRNSVDAA